MGTETTALAIFSMNMLAHVRAWAMLLSRGGYPMYAGAVQGKNVMSYEPELDDWPPVLCCW